TSVTCVAGWERDREQALLASALDQAGEVDERALHAPAVHQHPDPPALLDDENALAVARRRRDVERGVEAADSLQAHSPARLLGGRHGCARAAAVRRRPHEVLMRRPVAREHHY